MKIRTIRQQIIMMLLIIAMVLPGQVGVKAEDASSTFPTDDNGGTITITKYKTDSANEVTNGTFTNGMNASNTHDVLSGVEFTVEKVASISQVSDENGNVNMVYTITSDFKNTLGIGSDEKDDYTGQELESKLLGYTGDAKNLLSSKFENSDEVADTTDSSLYIAKKGTTGTDGKVTFSSLKQGLYLVVETAAPSNVTAKAKPFFVSIPSYVNYDENNTGWIMEVNAYPKNAVGTASMDKTITAVGGVSQTTASRYADVKIGDTIKYKLAFSVPVPADGLKQLYIVDEMAAGLDYTENTISVKIVDEADSLNPQNYSVDITNENQITIDFSKYLDTLNGSKGNTVSFEIEYECKVGDNAILGDTGNTNTATLYYSTKTIDDDSNPEQASGNAKAYTYGINLTKSFADGSTDGYSNVEFQLYTKDGDTEKTIGTYTMGSNNIKINGIKAGTYYLKEIKTVSGYILLKDPIEIVIADATADGGADTATVNGKIVTMILATDDTTDSKYIPITVVNDKGFSLPTTGAEGTAMFAFVGILLVLIAGTLLIIKKKQR